MEQLSDRVAIVTGAASGIGRATALSLAKEGACVVAADVARRAGDETVRLISEAGGEAVFVRTDVKSSEQVDALIAASVEAYGGLDILVANAGVDTPDRPVVDTSDEEWARVMDVNLTGVFRCCRAAIPAITRRGGGAIVATASDAGLKPFAHFGPYNASKAGVISLVKTLAVECAPLGIRVNAVAPGETDTAMGFKELFGDQALVEALEHRIPLKRIADPLEIAQVVLFLVSEASSYITGEVILVDGGRMLYDPTSQVLKERVG